MIPVLDFTRFTEGTDPQGFVADLGAAARGPGFFLLKGHGIDAGAAGGGLRPGRRVLRPSRRGEGGGLDPEDPALPGLGP
jgi:hypothetical protein